MNEVLLAAIIEKLDEIKKEIKSKSFSWIPFWIAGWLFSLGFIPFDIAAFNQLDWIDKIVEAILSFILWPFVLGCHLR